MHCLARPSAAGLLQAVNEVWPKLWAFRGAATGDESIVPHKGKLAGHMRQFIPRKPHSTGIKLYVFADSVHPLVTDVYLYAGKKVKKIAGRGNVVGSKTATAMVHRRGMFLGILCYRDNMGGGLRGPIFP